MQSNYTSQSSSNEIQIDHYDIQTEEFFASFLNKPVAFVVSHSGVF
jgi:hypothetical protein